MNTDGQPYLKKLAGGATIAVIGRFSGRLTALLGDVIAARVLGPAVFGIYSIGWTIFRLAELIAPLGLDMGVIRYGSLYLTRDRAELIRVIRNALKATFIFGTLLAILFYAIAPWLASAVFNKPDLVVVFRFFAFGFPLAGLLTVLAATTRLTQIMSYTVILQDFGQPFLALLFLVCLLLAGSRLVGVLLSDILSYGAVVLLGFYYVYKLFPATLVWSNVRSASRVEGFYAFSVLSSMIAVITTLVFWVDRLLIGYFLPARDSGIYQAVSQISVVFVVVQSGLNRIVIPILASLHHEHRKSEMQEIYTVSTKWGIYISIPVLAVLMLSPQDILAVTYGPEYTSGAILILVLLIGQTINLITGPVGPLLIATGHHKLTFALSGLSLLLNIFLNVMLIPQWGLLGAAVGTSVSLGVLYVVALFFAKQRLDLWPYDHRYWKGIIAAVVALLSAGVAKLVPLPATLPSLILQFTLAGIGFFAMLLLMKVDKEDLELLRLLRAGLFAHNNEKHE